MIGEGEPKFPRGLDRAFWIVDGVSYDLREWAHQHPGGAHWLMESIGRDITANFHTYHRDPERLRAILAKYRIEDVPEREVLPKMGVPSFLVPADFDAVRDLPKFDFHYPDGLLGSIRQSVNDSLPKKRLEHYDRLFDAVTGLIAIAHIAVLAALVAGAIAPAAAVVGMVLTRTSLAGAGHYYLHRKKPTPGRGGKPGIRSWLSASSPGLFDFNYIGTFLVGSDGHVLLHHAHLGYGADVKRAFLAGMLRLHPLLRIFGYTLLKLGMCAFAIPYLGGKIVFQPLKGVPPHIRPDFWTVRVFLLFELMVCAVTGHVLAWLVQFALTLWLNTYLVIASHDFENTRGDELLGGLPAHLRGDWAAQQIGSSYDLSVVGNRWIDVFLSAGLSPHRVHHVLPYQGSGFANIASEQAVRRACEAAGIAWEPPRNFLLERVPSISKFLFLSRAPAPPGGDGGPVPGEIAKLFHYVAQGWRTGAD
jgi:hypothetical protein